MCEAEQSKAKRSDIKLKLNRAPSDCILIQWLNRRKNNNLQFIEMGRGMVFIPCFSDELHAIGKSSVFVFVRFVLFDSYFNIDQTYSNVSLSHRLCSLCVHHVHEVSISNRIDFRASYDMDHILQLLMALSRLSVTNENELQLKFNFFIEVFRWINTSVRAQLQLIAVHKNMFMSNIMRNKMPNVMHNQRSHDGRIPESSQAGEITEKNFQFFLI